jgi:hypothetical protein
MSTIHIGGPVQHKAAAPKPKSQTLGLVIAVILLLVAAGLVISRNVADRNEKQRVLTASDPNVQLQQIRENPNMPPQAKAIAEARIKAALQETQARNASQPAGR